VTSIKWNLHLLVVLLTVVSSTPTVVVPETKKIIDVIHHQDLVVRN
jgi:hypothetical protein